MYLQKLELHGFKSFADRTEIHFAPGITAIVGPNGCGKSNIIDAVRWVLGEQRARLLRSEKMDNVIFNGAGKRKPLGLSEVSMTIENTRNILPTEYTDVTITRRLYRSGDSEYLINKTPCRLKDIIDLFMDTGMGAHAYSVIELKMTDDILSENAEDRRQLFEEAAGITRYKFRRTQALRKLKNTQTDLLRVRDLVEELEKRVRSLSRQAKKAARHKKISTRLDELERQVAQLEYTTFSRERSGLDEERGKLRLHIEDLTGKQTSEEAEQEAMRSRLVSLEQDLAERQRRLNAHVERIRTLESDLRLEKQRAESSARNLERTERERVAAEGRKKELQTELDRLSKAADEARPAVVHAQSLSTEAADARDEAQDKLEDKRKELEAARKDEAAAGDRLNAAKNESYRLQNRAELLESRKEEAERKADETGQSIEKLEKEQGDLAEEFKRSSETLERSRDRLAEAEQALEDLVSQEADKREELHQLERRYAGLEAEIEMLEGLIASYDDVSESVAFLASRPEWIDSRPLTVADIVACDEADRQAVEALLGDYAGCFVVESEKDAAAGIRLLKSSEKGRAAFFVLDRLPSTASGAPSGPSSALEAVRVNDDKYRTLIALLLRDAYIVDSLEQALERAKAEAEQRPSARYATRDGEWVEGTGRVLGGSVQETATAGVSRIGRRERLAKLRDQQSGLREKIGQLTADVESLERRQSGLALDELRKKSSEDEHAYDEVANRARQLAFRIELEEKNRRELGDDLTMADERQRQTLQKQIAAAQDVEVQEKELAALRKVVREAEKHFQDADQSARAAMGAFAEANLAAVQAQNALDTLLKDRERVNQELEVLASRDKRRNTEAEQYLREKDKALKRRTELDAKITQGYKDKAGYDEAVSEAETAVNQLKGRLSEQEVTLRDVRRLREEAQRKENSLATRLAEIGARLEDLVERILEDHDLTLGRDEVVLPEDFDAAAAREELPQLRQRLRNLGAVNELALESFEEEKERLDFMSEQLVDLEKAENTLLETISEINTEASRRFEETFERIRVSFQKLFSDLFGEGARADIMLTGDLDPLESPVEVIAYPKGKKPSTISQLSGGEKTLTAIALLFAIYLVKPSPFCILDEVDAPLDDANVRRFMNMIRSFSGETQFILVTHNKLTMEAADRMYGVTMPEQGVSKLVGVRFDELDLEEEETAEAA